VRAVCTIVAVLAGQMVLAEDLWIPLVQPSDVRVLQVLDDGGVLVQSGASAFVCSAVEQQEALVFDNCKPVLAQFTYLQIQYEAAARVEGARLQKVTPAEVDLATKTTLKLAGCSIELGAFDLFSNEALVAFAASLGVQSDLAPFMKETVERITRESLKRIFAAGEVVFLNNQTKISLKDCA
jgi:hypothetical protein